MYFLLLWIPLCISSSFGDVLFASNIDDFRAIAKRIIPEAMADQIADLVAANVKNKPLKTQKQIDSATSDSEELKRFSYAKVLREMEEIKNKGRSRKSIGAHLNSKSPSHIYNQHRISEASSLIKGEEFNQLVEKVKDRLRMEYDREQVTVNEHGHNLKETHITSPDQRRIRSKIQRQRTTKQDDKIFEKEVFIDNDSYENYKIPPKDYLVFSSEERGEAIAIDKKYYVEDKRVDKSPVTLRLTDRHRVTERDPVNIATEKNDYYREDREPTYSYKDREDREPTYSYKEAVRESKTLKDEDVTTPTVRFDEIKAQTENLNYNSKEIMEEPYEKRGATMIPTLKYFKGSTPNYIGTATAETYNFNEPIPEADREIIIEKQIDRHARINKKIAV